jgi:hypothetical protein
MAIVNELRALAVEFIAHLDQVEADRAASRAREAARGWTSSRRRSGG